MLSDGRSSLIFSDPVRAGHLPAEYLSVAIEGPELRASRQVYEGWSGGFESLATFLTGLAEDWRGWAGTREYRSIEGDLHIAATHDGHVNLKVLLWESTQPDGWRVEAAVRLDAGEQLARAAADVSDLVRAHPEGT